MEVILGKLFKNKNEVLATIIKQNFLGLQKQKLKCIFCSHERIVENQFSILNLTFHKNNNVNNIPNMLQEYLKGEVVDLKCENPHCQNGNKALK